MGDTTPAGGQDAPDVNRMFEVLSRRPRRLVLLSLLETAAPVSPSEYRTMGQEGLETTLRHVHLPKLVDAGYVEWDRDGDVVSTGPNFDEIEPLLRVLLDNEDELPSEWP